jgi:hypothetical protein
VHPSFAPPRRLRPKRQTRRTELCSSIFFGVRRNSDFQTTLTRPWLFVLKRSQLLESPLFFASLGWAGVVPRPSLVPSRWRFRPPPSSFVWYLSGRVVSSCSLTVHLSSFLGRSQAVLVHATDSTLRGRKPSREPTVRPFLRASVELGSRLSVDKKRFPPRSSEPPKSES